MTTQPTVPPYDVFDAIGGIASDAFLTVDDKTLAGELQLATRDFLVLVKLAKKRRISLKMYDNNGILSFDDLKDPEFFITQTVVHYGKS
jgi:hypothetical protein